MPSAVLATSARFETLPAADIRFTRAVPSASRMGSLSLTVRLGRSRTEPEDVVDGVRVCQLGSPLHLQVVRFGRWRTIGRRRMWANAWPSGESGKEDEGEEDQQPPAAGAFEPAVRKGYV